MRNHMTRTMRGALSALTALALVAAAGCSDVLKVQDPQHFASSTLDNPILWTSVANGAEGDFQLSLSNIVIQSGMLSDELWDSSTWIDWKDVSTGAIRANWATTGAFSSTMDALLRARYSAQAAATLFTKDMKDTANTSPLMVQVKTVDAWADLILGMNYCEAPPAPSAAQVSDTLMFQQAITKLTAALALAQAAHFTKTADQAAYVNWIKAGLARANLMVGNYDQALSWAQQIPPGYEKDALYSSNSTAQNNQLFFQGNSGSNRSYTIRGIYYNQIDTVAGYLKDWYSGQLDTRVPLTHDNNNAHGYNLGAGGVVRFFSNGKANSASAPIAITKYAEMQLIIAEVKWRKGDFGGAIAAMNVNRAAANLPPLVLPSSGDLNAWTQQALLSERFAQLFTEGHRLNDIYRFHLVTQLLGSGRATKLPMSITETYNNPSIGIGHQKCPAVS